MAKVKNPLGGSDARGHFSKRMTFKRGGIVTRYHVPRDPKSAAQLAQRAAFTEMIMSYLTREQADLIYALLTHLHDDHYSELSHDHNSLYSVLSHLHDSNYVQIGASDPFTQYHNNTRGDARYPLLSASDPYTQYHNNTRGDARYSLLAHSHMVIGGDPNDIYTDGVNHAQSDWAGTIATLPGGAPTTLTVNTTAGNKNILVPASTTQLANMVLYNTTRGTKALITNFVQATNTITLSANVPAGWVVGDVITVRSQTTVVAGPPYFVDYQFTSVVPSNAVGVILYIGFRDTGAANQVLYIHPFATYGAGNVSTLSNTVANVIQNVEITKVLNSRTFSMLWSASGAATVFLQVRLNGYMV